MLVLQTLTNNHENSEKEGLLTFLLSELREVIIRTEKIGN